MEQPNMMMMFILFVILICFAGVMYNNSTDTNTTEETVLETPGVVTLSE